MMNIFILIAVAFLAACASTGSGLGPAGPTGTLDSNFGRDYNSDGTPDGFVTYNTAGGTDAGEAIAIDSNGRILVAGWSKVWGIGPIGDKDLTVWRFTPNGMPDTAFGGDYNQDGIPDGYVTHGNAAGGEGGDAGQAVTIDSNGRILVAGWSRNPNRRIDLVLWAFTDQGDLDPSFGHDYDGNGTPDGYVLQKQAAGNAIAIDGKGRILIGGGGTKVTSAIHPGAAGSGGMLWRFTTGGDLDTSFGEDYDQDGTPNGYVFSDPYGNGSMFSAIAIDSRGTILTAGMTFSPLQSKGGYSWSTTYTTVWRFTASGQLDTSFGNGGFVKPSSSRTEAWAVAADGRNALVVGASESNIMKPDMMMWRFTVSGALDTTFGDDYDKNGKPDGYVRYDRGKGYEYGTAVALDPHPGRGNNVLVAGVTEGSSPGSFAHFPEMTIWRYRSKGILDTTFGDDYNVNGVPDGYVTTGGQFDKANAMAVDSSGRILVAGWRQIGGYENMILWRYH